MMAHVCWRLFPSLIMFLCFSNQVRVSGNRQSVNLLLLEPPDFPDLLYSFRQSLSASEKLRRLVSDVGSIPEIPCACGVLSHINWTLFSQRSSGAWLSEALLKDCTVQSVFDSPMIAVGNWTLESQPESGEMVEQGRALIIGISAGLTIALSVGAILVIFRKRQAAGQAVCQLVTRHRTTILRQHSDCQQIVSVKPSPPPLNPTESTMFEYHCCPLCCQKCLQTLLGCCSFLASYCKVNKSQTCVDVGVELQLLSELDKTDGLSADNSDNKCSSKPDNTLCDQNLSSLRKASTS